MALKDDALLGEILERMAQHMLRLLDDDYGYCDQCKRRGPTAADLGVMRALLNDNGITAAAKKGALHILADKLPFEDPEAGRTAHRKEV